MRNPSFFNSEEGQEFLKEIKQYFLRAQQPPQHIVFDDVELRDYLHVCKRTTASLRSERKISYSKDGGLIHYLLSDVLLYLEKHRVEAVENNITNPRKNKNYGI